MFEIKTGYYLKLLTPDTMKLIGSTLFNYQQDSRVLYTFVPNKSFGQLLDILPKKCTFLKTFNSEFPHIEVLFTDQNSKPLETEDKINSLVIIN